MAQLADIQTQLLSRRKNWTVDEYHAMIDAGILSSDDRVELLFGQIVTMHPVGHAHATTVKLINKLFTRRFVDTDYVIGVQDPVTLDKDSEPEPDLSVASGPLSKYLNFHPGPDDLLLLVEVSDTTLRQDRGAKMVGYALAGIKEYWIINVFERKLEHYLDPDTATGSYRHHRVLEEGDKFDSPTLGAFLVSDLMVSYQ